jgi:predicted ribosomally synthesized peptide with SipW-like signal peptide
VIFMVNKKIAMSALSIVTVVALVGGATFALFTDQATANDSTFASGNADLKLALDGGAGEPDAANFADSIESPDFSNLAPGFTGDMTFWMKNTSTSAISLDVVADLTGLSGSFGSDGVNHLPDALLVKWTCDTDDNGGLQDNTPTGEFSVNQWISGGTATLGTLAPGNAIVCRMHARVPATAGNEIQGDSVTFDTVYDATQSVTPTPTP